MLSPPHISLPSDRGGVGGDMEVQSSGSRATSNQPFPAAGILQTLHLSEVHLPDVERSWNILSIYIYKYIYIYIYISIYIYI